MTGLRGADLHAGRVRQAADARRLVDRQPLQVADVDRHLDPDRVQLGHVEQDGAGRHRLAHLRVQVLEHPLDRRPERQRGHAAAGIGVAGDLADLVAPLLGGRAAPSGPRRTAPWRRSTRPAAPASCRTASSARSRSIWAILSCSWACLTCPSASLSSGASVARASGERIGLTTKIGWPCLTWAPGSGTVGARGRLDGPQERRGDADQPPGRDHHLAAVADRPRHRLPLRLDRRRFPAASRPARSAPAWPGPPP